MKIDINLNETVYFKLTEEGAQTWLESTRECYGSSSLPSCNKDGWYEEQLWKVMHILGCFCGFRLELIQGSVLSIEKKNIFFSSRAVPKTLSRQDLLDHARSISKAVKTWPKWKQTVLDGALRTSGENKEEK